MARRRYPENIFLYAAFIAALFLVTGAILFAPFHVRSAHAQNIPSLDTFTSTSSPVSGITQRTYGKALIITGISTGNCLTLDSNHQLTTTTCGSGGGGTFAWTPTSYGNSTTSTLGLLSGLISVGSTTFSSLGSGVLGANNGRLYGGIGTTTASCSGTVSCSGFTIFGTSPITITGSSGTAASSTLLTDNNTFSGAAGSATTTINQSVIFKPTGNVSASESVGGAMRADFTGTNEGFHIFSSNTSSGPLLDVDFTGATANSQPFRLESTATNQSVINVQGKSFGLGLFKGSALGDQGNDGAIFSADATTNSNSGQAYFAKCNAATTTPCYSALDGSSNTLWYINGNGLMRVAGNSTTTGQVEIDSLSANQILYTDPLKIVRSAASSSIFGYTPLNPTRALTVAGTANQITSSAGSQDLSADRTWTLSFPSLIVNPNASTTYFSNFQKAYFGATATTTIDATGNIVIPSGSGLTITGKSDGCATFASGVLNSTGIACGSGGTSNGLATSSPVSAGNVLYYSSSGAGSATGAATTSLSVSGPFTIANPIGVLTNGAITYTGLATTSNLTQGQLLYNTTGGNGVASVATTSATINNGLTGTLTTLGSGQTIGLANINANSVLGNITASAGTPTSLATSSLFSGTVGQTGYFSGTGALVGTSTVYIGTNSFVGIGTTSPLNPLNIVTNKTGQYTALNIQSNAGQASEEPSIDLGAGLQGSTVRPFGRISAVGNASFATPLLKFWTDDGNGTITTRMVIDKNGYVGVGTTSPNFPLTAASSTGPQLALSPSTAGVGDVIFRAYTGGGFSLATSSSTGTAATSTKDMLTFDSNSQFYLPAIASASGNNCMQIDTTGKVTSTGSACGAGGTASTTLLSDSNTFSGSNSFTKSMTVSVSGTAGAALTTGINVTNANTSTGNALNTGNVGIFSQMDDGVSGTSGMVAAFGTYAVNRGTGPAIGTYGVDYGGLGTGDKFGIIGRTTAVTGATSNYAGGYFDVTNTFDVTAPTLNTKAVLIADNNGISGVDLFNARISGTSKLIITDIGNVGIGTSTPQRTLTVASSTAPQLMLTDGSINAPWNLRSIAGSLYLATSSATTFATSTTAALSINPNGGLSIPALGACSGSNALTTSAAGLISCGAITGGSGAYPFTPSTDGGLNTSATSTPIQGTNPGLGLDVSNTSWYGLGGRLLAYASTTNQSTILGIGSGGKGATTTAAVQGNTTIGYLSGNALDGTGIKNTITGEEALLTGTTSDNNTAFGYNALWKQNGSDNTAFGYNTLGNNVGYGSRDTAVGSGALATISYVGNGNNVAVGYNALTNSTTGLNNVGIGQSSLGNAYTSASTTAVGTLAGVGTLGYGNKGSVYVGYKSGDQADNNSDFNTLVGYQAGYAVSTGADNIIIGPQVDSQFGTGYATSTSNNIGIGYNTLFPLINGRAGGNYLNIGNFLYGTMPATTSASVFQLPTSGSFGVGSSSPYAKLSVQSNAGDTATTLFAIGSSTATATTTHFRVMNDGTIFAANTTSAAGAQTGYWCYDTNGQLIRDSAVCIVSARKFKTNIQDLSNDSGLAELMQVRFVSYYKKTPLDENDSHEQVGVIADDMFTIDPRLVTKDSNGDIHGFRYDQFTAIIGKSVQQLYTRFEKVTTDLIVWNRDQDKSIKKLEDENKDLRARLDALEAKQK